MLDEVTIEQRLATLEKTVSDLKYKFENQPISENWLLKRIGSISDEAAFQDPLDIMKCAYYPY